MDKPLQNQKLVLVLDYPHFMEKKQKEPLSHDGGRLLKFLLARLSIRRDQWVHTYVFSGSKEELPSKKKERLLVLEPHIAEAERFIELNKPCVVVGMGKLACEWLTGGSMLKSKAGTCWTANGYGKVWITYSTEAALYDPGSVVSIYGVLAKAAASAKIPTKFDGAINIFSWEDYL